jgi:hypothetical protein
MRNHDNPLTAQWSYHFSRPKRHNPILSKHGAISPESAADPTGMASCAGEFQIPGVIRRPIRHLIEALCPVRVFEGQADDEAGIAGFRFDFNRAAEFLRHDAMNDFEA